MAGITFALAACSGARAGSGVHDGHGDGVNGAQARAEMQELGPDVRREIGLDPEAGELTELSPELRREVGLDPRLEGQPAIARELSPALRREIGLDTESAVQPDSGSAGLARSPGASR